MFFRNDRIPRFFLAWYGLLAAWLATTAMHIPDGYLSPATSLVMFLLVLPFWARGVQSLRQTANARSVPVIALAAAFSFLIMMFNIPLPGGTTGHAVGGALAAVVLGPEIAVIVISTALVIQAFFFGDGGILAIGANCFNMAVVLPYVAASVYRAVSADRPAASRRRAIGAGLGGWAGLTAAAFFAGLEFGIQPALFHTADGAPLYAPYPLSVALPAMVIPHALLASVAEGTVTALVVVYLQRANPAVFRFETAPELQPAAVPARQPRWRTQWILLAALACATPLGLLAPGTAWGEWNSQELVQRGLGFVPQGLARLENLWGAPFSGYSLPFSIDPALGYVLSAVLGVALIAFLAWLYTSLFVLGGSPESR
ncbi:MAG TPA: cobalt transporter CbiM [Anaerolineaceae bacterium]|nr:cobalt transporter CbiM [Anaerolineaceae bacterium]